MTQEELDCFENDWSDMGADALHEVMPKFFLHHKEVQADRDRLKNQITYLEEINQDRHKLIDRLTTQYHLMRIELLNLQRKGEI